METRGPFCMDCNSLCRIRITNKDTEHLALEHWESYCKRCQREIVWMWNYFCPICNKVKNAVQMRPILYIKC